MGSAEKVTKIRSTVAELSVKNQFPIVNTNPQIPGVTAVEIGHRNNYDL